VLLLIQQIELLVLEMEKNHHCLGSVLCEFYRLGLVRVLVNYSQTQCSSSVRFVFYFVLQTGLLLVKTHICITVKTLTVLLLVQ